MPTFDAIGIVAIDMAKTLAFYRLLGLKFPEGAESEGHVEAELAGGFRFMIDTIAVVESFTTYEPPSGGHRVGFAFRCDAPSEVDATFTLVTGAGYEARTEPFDAFWGQRYATILDPDGNPVDLYATME
jgi:catechol 2,3-dioxygenase-like lactoylglutathione lyase family enzyme